MTCLRAVAGALAIVATLLFPTPAAAAAPLAPAAPHISAAPRIPAPAALRGPATSLALSPAALLSTPAAAPEGGLEEGASVAARRVDALLSRSDAAEVAVREALDRLTASFARTQRAEARQQAAAAAVTRQRGEHARRVRAVYAQGGGLGLRATILTSGDPGEALWRTANVDRLMTDLFRRADAQGRLAREAAAAEQERLDAAEQADAVHGRALDDAESQASAADRALADAKAALAALDAEARQQKAAAEAARRLAEAEARKRHQGPTGPVSAIGIPAAFEVAYRAAAPTCPGMRWTLLAAVGQVESGHGRNNGPSSAGAIGPMQFMPGTFRQYGVDGDHDGLIDPWDPEDAIFSAAHYLCTSGARGGTPEGVHDALFAYNRAEWYVQLVLATERAITTAAGEAGTLTTRPEPPT